MYKNNCTMKKSLYVLCFLIFCSKHSSAQDTLVWSQSSQHDPIYNLSVSCIPQQGLFFVGIYKDKYGCKACYQNYNYYTYCIYKQQMTYVAYTVNFFGDDFVKLYFDQGNEKCFATFLIKKIDPTLRTLFEGIPSHQE